MFFRHVRPPDIYNYLGQNNASTLGHQRISMTISGSSATLKISQDTLHPHRTFPYTNSQVVC